MLQFVVRRLLLRSRSSSGFDSLPVDPGAAWRPGGGAARRARVSRGGRPDREAVRPRPPNLRSVLGLPEAGGERQPGHEHRLAPADHRGDQATLPGRRRACARRDGVCCLMRRAASASLLRSGTAALRPYEGRVPDRDLDPDLLPALILKYIFAVKLGWLPTVGRQDVLISADHPTNFYILDGILTGNPEAAWDAAKHLILPAIALGSIPARHHRAHHARRRARRPERGLRPHGPGERHVVARRRRGTSSAMRCCPWSRSSGCRRGSCFERSSRKPSSRSRSWVVARGGNRRSGLPRAARGILFVAAVFVVVNLLVDLSYGFIDPRVRVS